MREKRRPSRLLHISFPLARCIVGGCKETLGLRLLRGFEENGCYVVCCKGRSIYGQGVTGLTVCQGRVQEGLKRKTRFRLFVGTVGGEGCTAFVCIFVIVRHVWFLRRLVRNFKMTHRVRICLTMSACGRFLILTLSFR